MKEIFKSLPTQDYVYYPSTSESRKISLKSDGTVEDIQIKTWEFSPVSLATVVFRDEQKNFVSRLQWAGKVFSGMDSKGWVELRPSRPDEINKLLQANRQVKLHGAVTEEPRKDRVNLRYNLKDQTGPRKSDTAVAIIACNRINYYKEVMEALAPQIKDYPVYVFLDKPEDDNQVGLQKQHEELTKTILPKANIVKRSLNFGCGLNLIDAREQLFTNLGYEKVFVFEDDMVPSKNYVKFCEELFAWSRQFSNVGAVQGWSRFFGNLNEKRRKNKEIGSTFDNLWGYLMSKECWDAMRTDFLDYTSFLSDRLYRNRDNMKISRWQHKFKQLNYYPKGENPFDLDELSRVLESQTLNNLATGQDGTTMLLMRHHGFVRLAPTVNRAKYIGKTGIHSTPEVFLKSGLDRVILDEISVPSEFKIRGKNAKQMQSI